MTPHQLAATAAAWSLHLARTILGVHVGRENRHNTASLLDAAPVLRSCSAWGVRHGVGGHGDPTAGVLLTRPVRDRTWAERQETADKRLAGIAAMLRINGPDLGAILDRIPALLPGTAAVLAQHLDDEDQLVRGWVEIGPARTPLAGIACPHCGERQLQVQTAGPVDAWTVVCATGRLCTGHGCGCGMPGAVEGAPHIWPRALVLGAVAGAAPTHTTRED